MMCLYSMSSSAKLYKWIDAEGKSHYADRPPPTLTTRPELIGESTTALENKSQEFSVVGSWWGLTDIGVRNIGLYESGAFRIHRWSYKGKQLDILFMGKWKQEGAYIILSYTHDFKKTSANGIEGTKEKILINKVNKTRLSLDTSSYAAPYYVRVNGQLENDTLTSKLLMGDWVLNDDKVFKFSRGTFSIRPIERGNVLAAGNWSSYNDVIELEFVYDFFVATTGNIGDVQHWKITKLDFKTLWITNVVNGDKLILERKM